MLSLGAQEQFTIVAELPGKRISSVGDLDAATAQLLLDRLQRRLRNRDRVQTGNSWDDRDEDTWIDKL